ncbi:uncharacterized protein LOC113324615 [Papaver somniferum]|uniref:uncharacterized protein LOC113324615 n=1 Tax=Papaver somniferum TaxID=3469 RepID=UPI000E6F925F|nr:uncharacterized protein LOC113324615 [Papaver somniferum]
MGIKIEMTKVFDRVNWEFLIQVMKQMGFSSQWCNLIHQCISTTNLVVLVNDSPGKFFKPTRGLKQGDPLSPYLFLFCMEALSRYLNDAESQGLIHGTKVCSGAPAINHLLFDDDCVIFCKANMEECNNIIKIFQDFVHSSGQLINFSKSGIFFSKNTAPSISENISDAMKVQRIKTSEKYLGSPLFTNRSKIQAFKPCMEKLKFRLAGWKSTLSIVGKVTMIQTVTSTSSIYQMNCFKIPKGTCKEIKRNFFWNKDQDKPKGLFYIAWDADIQNLILQTNHYPTTEDTIQWSLTQTRKFTVKSLYDRQINDKYASGTHTTPWKEIWKLDTTPAIQLFIWKCAHGIIPTNAESAGILNNIDPIRNFCKSAAEDITHVLLACPAASDVWRKFFGENHQLFTAYRSFHAWLNSWFIPDNPIASWNTTFATICWFIWKARCDQVFRNIDHNAAATALKITHHLCTYSRGSNSQPNGLSVCIVFANMEVWKGGRNRYQVKANGSILQDIDDIESESSPDQQYVTEASQTHSRNSAVEFRGCGWSWWCRTWSSYWAL